VAAGGAEFGDQVGRRRRHDLVQRALLAVQQRLCMRPGLDELFEVVEVPVAQRLVAALVLLHYSLRMPLAVDKPAALVLAHLDVGIQGLAGLGVAASAQALSTCLQPRDPVVLDRSLRHERAQPAPAGRVGLRIHRRARVQELEGLVHAAAQRAGRHRPGLASQLLGRRSMLPAGEVARRWSQGVTQRVQQTGDLRELRTAGDVPQGRHRRWTHGIAHAPSGSPRPIGPGDNGWAGQVNWRTPRAS